MLVGRDRAPGTAEWRAMIVYGVAAKALPLSAAPPRRRRRIFWRDVRTNVHRGRRFGQRAGRSGARARRSLPLRHRIRRETRRGFSRPTSLRDSKVELAGL